MVLRRAPRGVAVKSAHDMRREFDVLSALAPLYSKAPKALAFCDDASVIGAPFFLMERVRGVILRSPEPPAGVDLPPATDARALGGARRLARRAPRARRLVRPARRARQARGLRRAPGRRLDRALDPREDGGRPRARRGRRVARGAPSCRPRAPRSSTTTSSTTTSSSTPGTRRGSSPCSTGRWPRSAIRFSTSGRRWATGSTPTTRAEVRALPFGATLIPGNLSRSEVAARWAERTGRADADVLFAYVFGLFKIAVIAQQIYRRYAEGHTTDPRFAAMLHGVRNPRPAVGPRPRAGADRTAGPMTH